VFIASPGDVAEEVDAATRVIHAVSARLGGAGGFVMEPVRWETHAPLDSGRPQGLITPLLAEADVFIGILWSRFGTPTGVAESGTEEEFREALRLRCERGDRPTMMVFFSDAAVPMQRLRSSDGLQQFERTQTFRQEYQLNGGLAATYGDLPSFESQLTQHLSEWAAKRMRVSDPDTRAVAPIVPSTYLAHLRDKYSDVAAMGLRLRQGQSVRLNSVYVPLTIPASSGALSEDEHSEDRDSRQGRTLLLTLANRESLYVSGVAGSGKSTFCRWLLWLTGSTGMTEHPIATPAALAEEFPDDLQSRLPVLVSLAQFWPYFSDQLPPDLTAGHFERALRAWLEDRRLLHVDWTLVRAHLEAGTLLLLLDGIDEVPVIRALTSREFFPRRMILSALSDWIPRELERGNRVILTGRPYAVDPQSARRLGLTYAPLAPLAPPLDRLLVARWFYALLENVEQAERSAATMLEDLAERPELEPLLAEPMLLTAMCIVYNENRRLPTDAYDLYTRVVENVLYNRYPNDAGVIDLVRNRLSVVAYGMHTGAGLGESRQAPALEVTYDEIDQMLDTYRDRSEWVEQDIRNTVDTREELLSHSGLLLPRDERRAVFAHYSFQEYLAALGLLDRETDRLFEAFASWGSRPDWRATLSFTFGAQLARRPSPERSTRLVTRLIEEAESRPGELEYVIAECVQLMMARSVRLQPLVEAKFKTLILQALHRASVPARDRILLGVVLGQLTDPRIEDTRSEHAYVEVPGGDYFIGEDRRPFRLGRGIFMSRFPVTNSQYGAFINEGGYTDDAWWSDQGRVWRDRAGVTEPLFYGDSKWNGPTFPVVGVAFWEAEAFARWSRARLPTEWEWEVAARGPQGHAFPWGDEWFNGACNSGEAALGGTTPVGIFPQSRSVPFGLDDMAGNVWEWCDSVADEGEEHRILRGGSWYYHPRFTRSAYRFAKPADYRFSNVGFRVLRDCEPAQHARGD
jgi:formylglycine-generating enzyme required for sulfatase activity